MPEAIAGRTFTLFTEVWYAQGLLPLVILGSVSCLQFLVVCPGARACRHAIVYNNDPSHCARGLRLPGWDSSGL